MTRTDASAILRTAPVVNTATATELQSLIPRSRYLVLFAAIAICPLVQAETVQVKYHGPVPLDSFACNEVTTSSVVTRICYDAPEKYMVIRLQSTYYHYCEIDAATVRGLQTANSMGSFFNARIRGSGSDGPFDCRTHPIPKKYRL